MGCQLAFLNAKYVKSDIVKLSGRGNFGFEFWQYFLAEAVQI